jgi:hypothetical protein
MKLTITEGYKPVDYEVTYDFSMHVKDADSFNVEGKTYRWNVYETVDGNPFSECISFGETLDEAIQAAAQFLNDRAFMKRLAEENQARVERIAAQEVKKLENKLAKQAKKETHEKV